MSFVRPEARAAIRRWAEPAVAATVLAVALPGAARLFSGGGIAAGFALGVAVVSAIWLRAALLRAFLRRQGLGPGAVTLREGELAYFGPETGGVVALDEIVGVEVLPSAGGPVWRLRRAGGAALDIPADAAGADGVPAALSALPGFSETAALEALGARAGVPRPVWRRGGGAKRLSGGGSPPASA